jgi:hypothetical protein
MNRLLVIFARGLLSTPAYGQVREIRQAQSSGDQPVTSDPFIVITQPGSYRLLSNERKEFHHDPVTLCSNGIRIGS